MALSRISGKEDLYVGGIFALRRPSALEEKRITHILSVIKYTPTDMAELSHEYAHLSIDIDDMEDQDIVVHFPKMVRFIERGLYGDAALREKPTQDTHAAGCEPTGAVFVHCAMGKSRSVTAIVAWLLWKYPHRFGGSVRRKAENDTKVQMESLATVTRAIEWVRQVREIAEPNDGFVEQLALWWRMGCPADTDDAVERNKMYKRWAYKREVEESARIGRAPDRLRFEDEEEDGEGEEHVPGLAPEKPEPGLELRCKKCRRVLATKSFVVPHMDGAACPHFFIEPLSWMRSVLEEGELDGRLICPSTRCGASIGRYAWQGFKCSCGEWEPTGGSNGGAGNPAAPWSAGDGFRQGESIGMSI